MNGRKRHFLVDSDGLLLRVVVLPANVSDREGARRLLEGATERFPRLSVIWADQGYSGPELSTWVKLNLKAELVITNRTSAGYWLKPGEKPPSAATDAEPHRWVAERSFAWEGRNRRLAKDYEYLPETQEAFCYLGMAHLMLRRLTR